MRGDGDISENWQKTSWAADLAQALWRKSTWSAYNGNCVEAAGLRGGFIAVRDSKDAGCGPTLVFGSEAWGALLDALKKDDLPG
jgi:hypothetical protein